MMNCSGVSILIMFWKGYLVGLTHFMQLKDFYQRNTDLGLSFSVPVTLIGSYSEESCPQYMCNGYGIWINKDKLWWSLVTFNWLHEPWRASPESWHLSRYYYIYSSITFIQVENIAWELALKPGYYTIIAQYTTILFLRGITVSVHKGLLPGEDTHFPRSSAHLKSCPGKAPTHRALLSRQKSTPPSVTGFREPPRKPAWLQGNSLHDNGVFPVILLGVCS